MMLRSRLRVLMLILLALLLTAPAATAFDLENCALSLGSYDVADTDQRAIEAGLEYRLPPVRIKKIAFTPAVGIATNHEGSTWIYAGLRYDWQVSKRFMLTPQFATSLYHDGGGLDLGGLVEFRSGLEISVRVAKQSRVGLLFYHLSNARIYGENPGEESLLLTWSFNR